MPIPETKVHAALVNCCRLSLVGVVLLSSAMARFHSLRGSSSAPNRREQLVEGRFEARRAVAFESELVVASSGVIRFDAIVRVRLDVVERVRQRSAITRASTGDRSVITSSGLPWSRSVCAKNHSAAAVSRRAETYTSSTWPFSSTAR